MCPFHPTIFEQLAFIRIILCTYQFIFWRMNIEYVAKNIAENWLFSICRQQFSNSHMRNFHMQPTYSLSSQQSAVSVFLWFQEFNAIMFPFWCGVFVFSLCVAFEAGRRAVELEPKIIRVSWRGQTNYKKNLYETGLCLEDVNICDRTSNELPSTLFSIAEHIEYTLSNIPLNI